MTPTQILENIFKQQKYVRLVRDPYTDLIIGTEFMDGANFSLEPGGQLEFSSAPFENLKQLTQHVSEYLKILEQACDRKVVFLSHGTNPLAGHEHPLICPKRRYVLMTQYFNSAGNDIRGIDMMRHSGSVQVNLDVFGHHQWQNAVKVGLVLIAVTRSLFGNAVYFKQKKVKSFLERQLIWEHMDPTRSGYPLNLDSLTDCNSCECAYAQWARKAYVLFIEKLPDTKQPKFAQLTFEQWLKNGFNGVFPTIEDWQIHLTTLFPHLRLRRFLEIRHIDAQPFEHIMASVAFFYALLKTQNSRDEVIKLVKENGFDCESVFSNEMTSFSVLYTPLLNLAIKHLELLNEKQSVHALEKFKRSLMNKNLEQYPEDANDFVVNQSTFFPSQELVKNLN